MKLKKYIANCFLLLLPIFLWNIILIDKLPKGYSPAIFEKDIPAFVTYGEIIMRVLVFALPLIMVLSFKTQLQKIGLFIYSVGVLLYFSSWLVMIISPESDWSQSLIGFMAPAYTTIVWFIGIALIGKTSFLKLPKISLIYIGLALLFVVIHSAHAYIVFQNLNNP
ncbi:MAG: hypothetical protein GQ574_13790 [Crocinitomix sp.]|nr:hypothetical protein [Crocinitomix sp.]